MKTMIVSAFPACGKIYLYENQDDLLFSYLGESIKFTFLDSDSSKYKKHEGWEKEYVDDLEKKLGTADFLFICQYPEVLAELEKRNTPFVVVAPDNSEWISIQGRRCIKQQWFGRFVLRDNNHIKDFNKWVSDLKENYDMWTTIEWLTKYNPVSFFLLKQDEYLSSIIEDLYWKKERYACYTVSE